MLIIFFSLCRSIYPVGKNFFLIETVDNSKHYKPSNKIVIDVQAGVNILTIEWALPSTCPIL